MFHDVVQAMARDRRALTLWDLAREVVGRVFDAGADAILGDMATRPDIQMQCRQFREQASALGYRVPDDDCVLYMEVVRPLHLTHVHDGR